MALVLNDQQRLSFDEVLDRKKGLSLVELSRRLAECKKLATEDSSPRMSRFTTDY